MFRFGIMGVGIIAAKFCDAVKMVEEVEVAAVSSKSQERAGIFSAEYQIKSFYGSYEEMLQKEELDAVYIATTNNYHYENSLLCIRYHRPVLCEKCMFMTTQEAQDVFEKAGEEQVFVMEGMWSCFLPVICKTKKWIEDGRIGMIHLATYTGGINVPGDHRIFAPELGGGVMYDLMVYPIEILMYLINQKLVGVKTHISRGLNGVDVTDSLLLQFETCQAAAQVTAHSRIPSPCGIYGSKGYIRLEQTHRASYVELYDDDFKLIDRYESAVTNGFEYEIEEVIRCVRASRLESAIMPHSETLRCIEIFEKALEG